MKTKPKEYSNSRSRQQVNYRMPVLLLQEIEKNILATKEKNQTQCVIHALTFYFNNNGQEWIIKQKNKQERTLNTLSLIR